jgi:hypothetical protein
MYNLLVQCSSCQLEAPVYRGETCAANVLEEVQMKAAIVKAPGSNPVYGDFAEPVARDGFTVVHVKASALSHLTRSRASGSHYSSEGAFPAVAGTDGAGITKDGERVRIPETFQDFGDDGVDVSSCAYIENLVSHRSFRNFTYSSKAACSSGLILPNGSDRAANRTLACCKFGSFA